LTGYGLCLVTAFAWLWSLFIYLFITYILFYLLKKKNCGKKQDANAALQPLQPHSSSSLLDTLIEIQSPELYNMRILNKESFK